MIFHLPLAHDLNLVGTLTAAQYPYSISVGGLDVVSKVDENSVRISEAGPGGVSSMSFTIADTDSTVDFADGAEVRMWDYVRDVPMFLGWIEHVDFTPWAALGRTIAVSAYGIEASLDAVIIPSLVFHAADTADDTGAVFQEAQVLQLLAGYGPLRTGAGNTSSQATPIGLLNNPLALHAQLLGPDVDVSGMTIRQAFEAWTAAAFAAWPDTAGVLQLSADFWGGCRLWAMGGAFALVFNPSDYLVLTIVDTQAGTTAATDLTFSIDTSPGALTTAVYVKGGAAASTGWVVGDTTPGRREGYVTISGTLASDKAAAATAVLSRHGGSAGRGSLSLENYTPTSVHPGSKLVITDARLGWTTNAMAVTQIDKTIVPGSDRQNWTISFADPVRSPATAGPAASMRLIRSHTRGVQN